MLLIARFTIAIVLLGIAGFCVFGYMATFEPPGSMGWRIGYGVSGLACLASAVRLVFARSHKA